MPTYDLRCNQCKEEFTLRCSYDERIATPCPKCGSLDHEQHFTTTSPSVGDSVRLGVRTIDGGFREVLSKIHSAAGRRSNLASKLSRR
jgi:putative FmdB family regulatory protein